MYLGKISRGLAAGTAQVIAARIGRDPSVFSREIARLRAGYSPDQVAG